MKYYTNQYYKDKDIEWPHYFKILMNMVPLIILFCVFTVTLAGKHDIYSGFTVYGIPIRDRSDQITLYGLETDIDIDIDIWNHGVPGGREAHVMVSPEKRTVFLDALEKHGLKHYVHLADIPGALKKFDDELSQWETRSNIMRDFPFQTFYPTYAQVDAYMERLAREYPDLVSLVVAGRSFEGRPVKYLKISTSNFLNASKPVYFMDATMHAREWVTPSLAVYTMHRLVEGLRYEDRDVLENTDWIILPIVNPDGYEYSKNNARMWRRSRSFNSSVSLTCRGADINRNFDIHFNTIGVSSNPCSDIYPGPQAFSEPETRYVRDIIHENMGRIQLYMDVHSYGSLILYGFDNDTLPPNVAQIHHLGAAMGAAIDVHKLATAPFYIVGNGNYVLYGVSGSGQDYAQDAGVPFSYTLELPDYGYGFLVPPEFIGQINMETWEGIVVSARIAYLHYQARIRN